MLFKYLFTVSFVFSLERFFSMLYVVIFLTAIDTQQNLEAMKILASKAVNIDLMSGYKNIISAINTNSRII